MFATISLLHSSLLQSCCVGLQHHHNQAKAGQKGFVRSLNSIGSNLISATNRHNLLYLFLPGDASRDTEKKKEGNQQNYRVFIS